MAKEHISPLILALLAALTGIFAGISTWALASVLGWPTPLAWGVVVWAISSSASWLVLLKRWWVVLEALLDVDINQDGFIGEALPPRIVIMDETDKGRTQGKILHKLPGGEGRFARLSAGVLDGTPLAERYWTGSRGPYSLNEYRNLRDYLLLRGLLTWQSEIDHRQGVEIEPAGRALMRHYAQILDNSLPIQEGDEGE